MSKVSFVLAALSIFMFTAAAACSPGGSASVEPSSTPETIQPAPGGHLCDNPFYPVVTGATWTYSSTGISGATEPYTFTDTVTDIRADGFTLTSQYADLTRTQNWTCTPGGLTALQLGSGPAGGISTSQLNLDITTSNIQGVTVPAAISAGQTWTYSLDLEGTAEIAGASGAAQGTLVTTFNAVGPESVTVPAGTFEAIKVLVDAEMDILATYLGLTVPVTVTTRGAVWFVPNVGWVKMENSGDLQGTSFSETISLESYSIPR